MDIGYVYIDNRNSYKKINFIQHNTANIFPLYPFSGGWTWSNLISIDNIYLPNCTRVGGHGGFQYSINLASVNNINIVNSRVDGGLFRGCTNLTFFNNSAFTNCWGNQMFLNCVNLKTFNNCVFNNIINAQNMFFGCTSLTTIPKINGIFETVVSMFENCTNLVNASNINIANIYCNSMFRNCFNLQELNNCVFININCGTSRRSIMFANCNNLTKITNCILKDFDTVVFGDTSITEVSGTTLDNIYTYVFPYQNSPFFNVIDISNTSIINMNDITNLFNVYRLQNVENLIVSNINKCTSLIPINISTLNNCTFNNINSASSMFYNCTNLTTLNNCTFNNINSASSMFDGCSNLISLNNCTFNNINNAYNMFRGCSNLTNMSNISVIDGDASHMFYNCTNLISLNNCTFNNITDAFFMFYGCTNLIGYSNQILRDANGNYIDTHTDPGEGLYTFNNCVNLTDYNEIHANWK